MIILVMRNIDLFKAMRTFVKVAELESFSAASRDLNIVASAVSRQVSDIEEYFDCQFLYRTTRAMNLTAEGLYYLEQFKEIINRLDDLKGKSQQRHHKIAGHLRISAPTGSASLGFLKAASDYVGQHPDLRLSWLFVNRFVNLVEEGVDLAIRVGDLPDSSFIARRYAHLRISFVASPDYLKRHGQPLHPKELSQHQCILDSSNRLPGRWRYKENGKEEQVAIRPHMELNDGDNVASCAADGLGIAYIPTFLMQNHIDEGRLVTILDEFELEQVPISLVYPSNRMVNPALRGLIDHILKSRE